MKLQPHHHRCSQCGDPVECDGDLELNFDGFPDVICTSYHLASGINPNFICEDCADKLIADEAADARENV